MVRGFWIRTAAVILAIVAYRADAAAPPTVGIEGQMEAILPVPGLRAKPVDRNAPIAVRIASAQPHGNLVRYDLRYIGTVAGRFDLRPFLVLEDGSLAPGLPELGVEIAGLLPAEHDGGMKLQPSDRIATYMSYKTLMIGAMGAWAALGIPLLLGARRRKHATQAPPEHLPSLIELLRPLVESAMAGRLAAGEKAQLERMLIGHWRERLDLDSLSPPEAMARLRADPEGGVLLRALEDWLHRPPGRAEVDLEAVLSPYRDLPHPVTVSDGARNAGV